SLQRGCGPGDPCRESRGTRRPWARMKGTIPATSESSPMRICAKLCCARSPQMMEGTWTRARVSRSKQRATRGTMVRGAIGLVLMAAAVVGAQPQDSAKTAAVAPSMLCWPESERSAVEAFEKQLMDAASAAKLRAWHDLLASEPHVAGTPGDVREVERI